MRETGHQTCMRAWCVIEKKCVKVGSSKPWTSGKELYKTLKYSKKTAHITKDHWIPENIVHMYKISGVSATDTPVDRPKESQK